MIQENLQKINTNIHPSLAMHQGESVALKQPRSSNLELYRIICMLMIVAHHYVVNSGLGGKDGLLITNSESANSLFLLIFGAWGKTGINCFLMITGYFMCTSKITLRKYLKLLLQVYFYKLIIFSIFLYAGYETLSINRIAKLVMPFWNINTGFVECFIVFYLTIPFWNILINNLNKNTHALLLILLLMCYTMLGSIPDITVQFNYVTWFGIIYLIASYIRLYPQPVFEKEYIWGWMTLASFIVAICSILVVNHFTKQESILNIHFFVSDCNKIFAVMVAVCSFLWFKNMKLKYSKMINSFGAGTFGVLLIHANSAAMRTWLWKDTVDVVGHYSLPLDELVLYSVGVVLVIFFISNLIDQLRIATIEKWFLRWYDSEIAVKADSWISKLTTSNNN